jgi:hypothetical protein
MCARGGIVDIRLQCPQCCRSAIAQCRIRYVDNNDLQLAPSPKRGRLEISDIAKHTANIRGLQAATSEHGILAVLETMCAGSYSTRIGSAVSRQGYSNTTSRLRHLESAQQMFNQHQSSVPRECGVGNAAIATVLLQTFTGILTYVHPATVNWQEPFHALS